MAFHSTRSLFRSSLATAALGLGITMAGCGGGGDDLTAASTPVQAARQLAASTAPMHQITVQGCVLDRHYIPTTGTPVRVLAADGRLLGSAQSDGQGRFALRLPAHSEVLLQVDRPQGESLPMRVDVQPSTWGTCLVDEAA
jgi:hypothetical protein